MWQGVGAAVGAALIGAGGSMASSNATNVKSKREAQRQRDWQERMSNTAHQREVADLEKAGLNPILTATGGSGASTGNSGLASVQGFDTSNAVRAGSDVFSKATQKRLAEAQERGIDAQALKNEADALYASTLAHNATELMPFQKQQIISQTAYSQNNALLSALQIPGAQAQANMYNTKFGQIIPYINAGAAALGNVSNATDKAFDTGFRIYNTFNR